MKAQVMTTWTWKSRLAHWAEEAVTRPLTWPAAVSFCCSGYQVVGTGPTVTYLPTGTLPPTVVREVPTAHACRAQSAEASLNAASCPSSLTTCMHTYVPT